MKPFGIFLILISLGYVLFGVQLSQPTKLDEINENMLKIAERAESSNGRGGYWSAEKDAYQNQKNSSQSEKQRTMNLSLGVAGVLFLSGIILFASGKKPDSSRPTE